MASRTKRNQEDGKEDVIISRPLPGSAVPKQDVTQRTFPLTDKLVAIVSNFARDMDTKFTRDLAKLKEEYMERVKYHQMYTLQGVSHLNMMANSRLLNLAYLKKVRPEDNTLDEGGCRALNRLMVIDDANTSIIDQLYSTYSVIIKLLGQNVDLNREDVMEQETKSTVFGGNIANLRLQNQGRYICHHDGCSLQERLREIFTDTEDPRSAIVLGCCQRHQMILRNTPQVTIHMSTQMPVFTEDGKRHEVFINVVLNGMYFKND